MLADQVPADHVGHDLAGVRIDLSRDGGIDQAVDHAPVVREHDVAADVIADDADPAAGPALDDHVAVDSDVLRRVVPELARDASAPTVGDQVAMHRHEAQVHAQGLVSDDVSGHGRVLPGRRVVAAEAQHRTLPDLDVPLDSHACGRESVVVEEGAVGDREVAGDRHGIACPPADTGDGQARVRATGNRAAGTGRRSRGRGTRRAHRREAAEHEQREHKPHLPHVSPLLWTCRRTPRRTWPILCSRERGVSPASGQVCGVCPDRDLRSRHGPDT